ncbi:MAG TPA: hypothetical protein VHF65_02735 [Nitrososphaera sp.]|nr:hypothetical protein [Nitrososphaera sp.]
MIHCCFKRARSVVRRPHARRRRRAASLGTAAIIKMVVVIASYCPFGCGSRARITAGQGIEVLWARYFLLIFSVRACVS